MRNLVLALCVFFCEISYSENYSLSFAKAMELGLKKNFDIILMKQDVRISENNKKLIPGSYLPTVDISSQYYHDFDNDGLESSLLLSWTLFDGFQMFTASDLIKKRVKESRLNLREQIENSCFAILRNMADLIYLDSASQIKKEKLAISAQRYQRAKYKYEFNSAYKIEYLNSSIIYNKDSLDLLNHKISIQKKEAELKLSLGISSQDSFQIADSLSQTVFTTDPVSWKKVFLQENTEWQKYKLQKEILKLNQKVNTSNYYPKLSLNTTSSLDHINNDVDNRIQLKLDWNLFSGFKNDSKGKNLRVEMEKQNVVTSKLENTFEVLVSSLLFEYENLEQQYEILLDNLKLTRQEFSLNEELFDLGQISNVDYRESQLNLFEVQLQLVDIQRKLFVIRKDVEKLSGKLQTN